MIPKEQRLTKEITPSIIERLTRSIHVRFLSEVLPEQFTAVSIGIPPSLTSLCLHLPSAWDKRCL